MPAKIRPAQFSPLPRKMIAACKPEKNALALEMELVLASARSEAFLRALEREREQRRFAASSKKVAVEQPIEQ